MLMQMKYLTNDKWTIDDQELSLALCLRCMDDQTIRPDMKSRVSLITIDTMYRLLMCLSQNYCISAGISHCVNERNLAPDSIL